MKKQLSFEQYRSIDLTLFLIILAVFESVIAFASGTWFPSQLYTVSIVAAVTAIVMVRWGAWSAIHAVAGGVVLCLVFKADASMYAIYCIGNLFSLFALIAIKFMTKKRIREDSVFAILFGLCVQLLMQSGRAAVAFCLGNALKDCLGFFSTDSLSILFTMVIVWIARRQDGLLEDQAEYIHRLKEEEKNERI